VASSLRRTGQRDVRLALLQLRTAQSSVADLEGELLQARRDREETRATVEQVNINV
jgi:hypothetical protein